MEMSLRRLVVERIDLYYLHRVDPLTPLVDQVGVLAEAQQAGKIRHIGLSKVAVEQIIDAAAIAPIAAVQNRYNLTEGDDDVLAHCEHHGIAFVPYKPLAAGALAQSEQQHDGKLTPAQAAIAYLLDRSPNMLPIPGTSDLAHLEDNTTATIARDSTASTSMRWRTGRMTAEESQRAVPAAVRPPACHGGSRAVADGWS